MYYFSSSSALHVNSRYHHRYQAYSLLTCCTGKLPHSQSVETDRHDESIMTAWQQPDHRRRLSWPSGRELGRRINNRAFYPSLGLAWQHPAAASEELLAAGHNS
ncbi:hypothetical protein BGW36DRAFT_378371 [Talaromyces proteolyticus]|uniref:Uncharacterized protein n=1 Tax=Talaromyces proteolyticus TaxID=1131652 RepID=A0AAD4KSC0_9EURO|nr:uncharacterized protein BGW36DRAFT_378371 [Talaromyces proteolyticus]KAH8697287.1 hypothetical protein BGW36DRAFT_378371 [Talaromyces proteolyticus]